jgi:hypothetical protein
MSFVAGLFLLALPLIAVPIAIHMLKKRQRDVIPWGAMQFLREPTRRGQRMSQMDRWMLLAARMLILACLVGALAQPILSWGQNSDANGLPLQLVLIDDTRSTLTENKFAEIRSAADKLIASLPTDTPVQAWAIGHPARRIATSDGTTNCTHDQIRSAIADYRPRGCDGNFVASVRQAISAASRGDQNDTEQGGSDRSNNVPLDAWLLSDNTSAGWKEPLSTAAMLSGSQQRLHLIQLDSASGASHQLAVASVESGRRAIAMNETIGLSASVVNHGPNVAPAVTGVWKHNGKAFAEDDMKSLQPGEHVTVPTQLSIKDAGTHAISFELKSPVGSDIDSMAADNVGNTVVQVIGVLPLLVISKSKEEFGGVPNDADYLAAALGRNLGGWTSGDDVDSAKDDRSETAWQSLFRPVVVSMDDLADVDWQKYPVFVWLGGSVASDGELAPDVRNKLIGRVRQGAGLWVTLDAQTNRDAMNALLGSRGLGIGSNADSGDQGLIDRLVVNSDQENLQRLHPPDPTDSILAALSDTERLDLDVVRIRRRIALNTPLDESASRVLLRTFEGDPVALLSSVGRGRVVVQALPLNPTWSNFPLSKSFVVWVLQLLDHLSQPISENYNLAAGQMFRQRVDSIDHEYELTKPDGEVETLIALPRMGSFRTAPDDDLTMQGNRIAGVVRFDQTEQPGLYHLRDVDDPDVRPFVFSVAGDPDESNCRIDRPI